MRNLPSDVNSAASSNPAPANPGASTTHVVQRGEILSRIALQYGVSAQAIAQEFPEIVPQDEVPRLWRELRFNLGGPILILALAWGVMVGFLSPAQRVDGAIPVGLALEVRGVREDLDRAAAEAVWRAIEAELQAMEDNGYVV